MRRFSLGLTPLLVFALTTAVHADPPKKEAKAKLAVELPTGNLDTKDWLKAPVTPLEPGELDRLVASGLKAASLKAAPVATDEQFIRRVYLDLAGKLPNPTAIADFVKDTAPDK